MSHIRVGAAGLIATLALLVGLPVAGAAPPWSAPASLPGDVPPVYAGGTVASQNGMTLVHEGALLNGKLVWLAADGSLLRVQLLPQPLAAAPVEVSANRFALLQMRRTRRAVGRAEAAALGRPCRRGGTVRLGSAVE